MASRNLAVAGNFNLTNSKLLFEELMEYGLDPVGDSDTQVVLEKIGYYLDREHEHLAATMGPGSFRALEGRSSPRPCPAELDLVRVLRNAADRFDGGYVFASIVGNGDLLICRDPAGIRPAFIYRDEAVVAVGQRTRRPGHRVQRRPRCESRNSPPPTPSRSSGTARSASHRSPTPCLSNAARSNVIYFSRGNDRDIYRERKRLGANLAERVPQNIDWDIDDTVFGFIPNTAETAFAGLREEIDADLRRRNGEELWKRIAVRRP